MVATTTNGRCEAVKVNGERCGAYAMRGSRFCYWHSPETVEERQEARSRGGKARHGRSLSEPVDGREFKTLADILDVLSLAVRSTLALEPSVSRNRALGYLARCWSEVYETGELEERLDWLESEVMR